MSFRRTSSSASFPATGRSKSLSSRISRDWHSGSRSRSPADGPPRHNPGIRSGACVPHLCRSLVRAAWLLGLTLCLQPALLADQAAPDPEPSPAPPAAAPTPPPRDEAAPPRSESAPAGQEETSPPGPVPKQVPAKGVIGAIVV